MTAIPAELLTAARQANQDHVFANWAQLDDAQRQRLLQDAAVSCSIAACEATCLHMAITYISLPKI